VTARVLRKRSEIEAARAELQRRGLSELRTSFVPRILHRRLGIVTVGDLLKSWDVLTISHFIEEHVDRDAPILDIGAFSSEVLCALHKNGYRALKGIDLNRAIGRMPYAEAIDYRIADFMNAPFDDGTFAAITAVSVIEHGYDGAKLFAEVARLLRPGGYFLATFDYWPEKVDTSDTSMFDMTWTIFSRDEIGAMVAEAGRHGLKPVGELELDSADRVIHWSDRDYTFAFVALQK